MSESGARMGELQEGEVYVRDAVKQSTYSHSHIIHMLKDPNFSVTGREVDTPFGKVWVVNLQSLLDYQKHPRRGGRKKGQKLQREPKQQEHQGDEATKTEAAPSSTRRLLCW